MRAIALAAATLLTLAACEREQPAAAPEQPAATPAAAQTPPAPANPNAEPGVVPAALQGEWNQDLTACGTGMHDSRLEITADEIRFYESGGPVKSVSEWEPGQFTVLADLSGEGEMREATYNYRLSPDGKTLTDLNGNLQRSRCP